jgi:hypothetical protein
MGTRRLSGKKPSSPGPSGTFADIRRLARPQESQHYVYIGVQPRHINLGFYQGSTLEDPEGLLEGAGKSLRHVKLNSLAAVEAPGLRLLVRSARLRVSTGISPT